MTYYRRYYYAIESKAGVLMGVFQAGSPEDALEQLRAQVGDGTDADGKGLFGSVDDYIIHEGATEAEALECFQAAF